MHTSNVEWVSWRELVGMKPTRLSAELIHAVALDGTAEEPKNLKARPTLGDAETGFDRISAGAANMIANGWREDLGTLLIRNAHDDEPDGYSDGWHRGQMAIEAGQTLAREGDEDFTVPIIREDMTDQEEIERLQAGVNHRDLTSGQRAAMALKFAAATGLSAKELAARYNVPPTNIANGRLIREKCPVLWRCIDAGKADITLVNHVRVVGLAPLVESREVYQVTESKPNPGLPPEGLLKDLCAVGKRVAREAGPKMVGAGPVRQAIAKIVRSSVKDPTKLSTKQALLNVKTELNTFKAMRKHAAEQAEAGEATEMEPEATPVSNEVKAQARQAAQYLGELACGALTEEQLADKAEDGRVVAEYVREQAKRVQARLGKLTDEQLTVRLKSVTDGIATLESYFIRENLERALSRAQSDAAEVRAMQAARAEAKAKESEEPAEAA